MSFSSDLEKMSSFRDILVRIKPTRHINSYMVSIGGGKYQLTFNYPINTVMMAGVLYTQVFSFGALISNRWYIDPDTNLLTIMTADNPSIESNVFHISYSIFYCSGDGIATYDTPTDSSTKMRQWAPRVKELPRIKQSVSNLTSGVFTLESTSIDLANADNDFQQYLTRHDSFCNKDIDIWLYINTTDNIRKIFKGRVRGIAVNSQIVSLTILDDFAKLQQSALFGDFQDEAFYDTQGSVFSLADPNKQGLPVHLMIGKYSRWKTKSTFLYYDIPDKDNLFEAVDTDFDDSISTSTNREWGLCRSADTLANAVFPTSAAVSKTIDGTLGSFIWSNSIWDAEASVAVGDYVKADGSFGTRYMRVVKIIRGGSNTTVSLDMGGQSAVSPPETTMTLTDLPSVFVVITDLTGNEFIPYYGLDFTVSSTTTSGGNYFHKITFDNNFEASVSAWTVLHPTLDFLDPGTCKVFYRIGMNTNSAPHGEFLKRMVLEANMDVDSASFGDADTELDANVAISIPLFDETELNTYFKYCEDILQSTLGFLTVNVNSEVEYNLISDPVPTVTVDENEFLNSSLDISIDYNDIATVVRGYNPYVSTDPDYSFLQSANSFVAPYLHSTDKLTYLRHYLDDISDRIDAHLAIKSNPQIIYTLKTATKDLETEIADAKTVISPIVLGTSGTDDLLVVGIEKSADNATVTLTVVDGTS